MLKDELQALQLAYNSLEMKFGKVQEENRELVQYMYVLIQAMSVCHSFSRTYCRLFYKKKNAISFVTVSLISSQYSCFC